MAKLRSINTKFWDDSYIIALDSPRKLLFLYLLTNPLTNIAGCYEISVRRIVFDTGLDEKTVREAFESFARDGRIFYRDGWVLIKNFIKNQSVNPKIIVGIQEVLKTVPGWAQEILTIAYNSLSHLNSNSNLNSNSKEFGGNISPCGENISQTPQRKTSESDNRKDHNAVKMVREISGRFPHKDLWDRIIRELGDNPKTEFFRKSFEIWRAVNGNPMNFEKWLFEPNKTGLPPEIYEKNGSSKKPFDPGKNGGIDETEFDVDPKTGIWVYKLLDETAIRERVAEFIATDGGDAKRNLPELQKFYKPKNWKRFVEIFEEVSKI